MTSTKLPRKARNGPRTGDLVSALRPRQWSKNLLVLAAPLLSGQATEGDVLVQAAIAFVAFCLAASGVYLVNDARDVEGDRAHPTKRFRPIASGAVPLRTAYVVGAVLQVASLAVALAGRVRRCCWWSRSTSR